MNIFNNGKLITVKKNGKIYLLNNNKNNPPEVNINETEIPYIQIYPYQPKTRATNNFVIPMYFTDYYQREYAYNDNTLRFKLRYELDGNVSYIDNLPAGDFNLNLGKLSKGMHWYSIQVEDELGRVSRRIFNDIWAIDDEHDITPSQTYIVSEADLSRHSINKNNSKVVMDMINNRVGLTALFSEIKTNGYRKCVLPFGIYRVNRTLRQGVGMETPIDIPSQFTVDMNGSTFKMHEYSDTEYGEIAKVENLMVRMKGTFDSHIQNGVFEGDYFERQANGWIYESDGEHSSVFYSYGAEFSSLDNITIKQTTGYNVCAGQNGSYGLGVTKGWVDNLAIINGIEVTKEGYTTCELGVMDSVLLQYNYIVASVWLATGGLKGNYWDMDFHFYDDNQSFIETIKVYQYTRCRIPVGAKYFRATFRCKANDIGDLSFHHMKCTRYFELNDCEWIDNRTCAAPFQSQFYTYNNCKFTRSGKDITPCEIDLEDGWEQQQDIFIRGCEIIENVGTGDVIDNSGINHVVENCKNFGMTSRYRINGITLRNNENCGFSNTIGWMTGNTIRVYGNIITGLLLEQTQLDFFNYEKTKVYIKNNTLNIDYYDRGREFYHLDNNEMHIKGTIKKINLYNSTVYVSTSSGYVGEFILFKNCNIYAGEGFSEAKFSFNALNADRKYIGCTYHSLTNLVAHNNFNSGLWDGCVFKEIVTIKTNNTNSLGKIQFNNCIFKKNIIIDTPNGCYIQFNDCTFEGGKTLQGSSNSMCEFNNCVG